MKKLAITSLVIAMVVGLGLAFADKPADGTTGNGAPKVKMLGKVNIIGVKNPKSDNMDDNGGGVIFVALEDKSKIYLVESGTEDAPGTDEDDFVVLDKNGTDRDGALLALPNTGMQAYVIGDETEMWSGYSVFVRPLGKPGGWATITTCAELVDGTGQGLFDMLPNSDKKEIKNLMDDEDVAYCSVEQVGQDITLRENGKSTFTNVTAELLTIVFEIDLLDAEDNLVATYFIRVPIFDPLIQGEYWWYDNNGLKNLEVRFYDMPTNVVLWDGPYQPVID